MDIEIVAPRKSDDGIVFYVSGDGTKTGTFGKCRQRIQND